MINKKEVISGIRNNKRITDVLGDLSQYQFKFRKFNGFEILVAKDITYESKKYAELHIFLLSDTSQYISIGWSFSEGNIIKEFDIISSDENRNDISDIHIFAKVKNPNSTQYNIYKCSSILDLEENTSSCLLNLKYSGKSNNKQTLQFRIPKKNIYY